MWGKPQGHDFIVYLGEHFWQQNSGFQNELSVWKHCSFSEEMGQPCILPAKQLRGNTFLDADYFEEEQSTRCVPSRLCYLNRLEV